MIDFFYRVYARALSQPPPKIFEQLDKAYPGPVEMPKFWQVMILPTLIMLVVLLVTL